MASEHNTAAKRYGQAMENLAHENAYRGFIEFVGISSVVVGCWVLALAVGGVKHAWITAVVGVVVSGIAGAIGASIPSIGIKAPAIVAVALALLLLFY